MGDVRITADEKAAIEKQLTAALQGAHRLKEEMLAYLLEMALEELRGKSPPSAQDWRS